MDNVHVGELSDPMKGLAAPAAFGGRDSEIAADSAAPVETLTESPAVGPDTSDPADTGADFDEEDELRFRRASPYNLNLR